MSMNQYMHPRNIYKTPPDFKKLALEYPEFKKHVKLNLAGKAEFEFKDPEALRALSCTLLKKDFGLDVNIPKNKLVPTIPLRLNYILWIEDLLSLIQRSSNIKGIDIGTGASCIYPLIAAKKNQWSMLATESDNDSIQCAVSNIGKNSLESLITVAEVTGKTLLEDIIDMKQEYDFCMCNPPFFCSTQELHPFFKSRKQNRPYPKNAFVASVNEVVAKGGEVEFIQKIINESKIISGRIKLYTTMIGQKSHLPGLKKSLREANVHSFKETEFCQGNTTRWGLAWTFLEYDLRKAPGPFKLATALTFKQNAPITYEIPDQQNSPENLCKVTEMLLHMFKHLKMTFEDVTRNKSHQRFFITAYSNTWAHQRRKRRETLRKNCESFKESTLFDNNNIQSYKTEEQESSGKRTLEELCESTSKKLRLRTDSDSGDTSSVFFKFMFAINSNNNKIILELSNINDYPNREYLHEIRQYIKNASDKIFQEKNRLDVDS